MINKIKYILLGSPLPTQEMSHKRLNKIRALASFSPDALSSIAYANQEIYLGLLAAGYAGLSLSFPICLAITLLLLALGLSYYQTIQAYPSGGGSFIVARENLGTLAGLVAAAALLVDYLLTAAVSLTAGVDAIASAFPALWAYRVPLALLFLVIITLLNLRGVQETGTMMSIPVYFFVFSYLGMLLYGGVRALTEGPGNLVVTAPPPLEPLTLLLVLHAFSSGCTALTGIEAISNGVQVFKPPESKNAGQTLAVMAVLMGTLFVGSIGLTQYFAVVAGPQETILSALARNLVGNGLPYISVQVSTMLILTVAVNTSFAGFPRLAAILAAEGFLPRQLTNLGDRLVYQNGNLLLAFATAVMIILFKGDTHMLIPLFAVGVFMAFTLSQAGMVVHWWRVRSRGWQWKMLANGFGALATAVTLLIVGYSKFIQGAWISIFLIPLLVLLFQQIRRHYNSVASQLTLRGLPPSLKPVPPARLVIPVASLHRGVVEAINYARSMSSEVVAVYIEINPVLTEKVRTDWVNWFPDIRLDVVPSPYRSIVGPLLDYLDWIDAEANDGLMAGVILPEFVPAHWWQAFLHNQTAGLIRTALIYRRRNHGYQRVIIDVPLHLK